MRNAFLIAGAIALGSYAHAVVLLDDFTSGFATVSTTVDANYSVNAAVPGGHRSIAHDFNANPRNRSILTDLNQSLPGFFFIEAGSNVDGAVDIFWAGRVNTGVPNNRPFLFDFSDFAGLAASGGAADLSSLNAFRVGYVGNDQPSTTLVMQVKDTSGNISVFSGTPIAAGNGSADIFFSSFTGSASFAAIDGIHLRVVLPTGNDVTLTSFEAVPEPATMVALGLGAAAFAARRRRKA